MSNPQIKNEKRKLENFKKNYNSGDKAYDVVLQIYSELLAIRDTNKELDIGYLLAKTNAALELLDNHLS